MQVRLARSKKKGIRQIHGIRFVPATNEKLYIWERNRNELVGSMGKKPKLCTVVIWGTFRQVRNLIRFFWIPDLWTSAGCIRDCSFESHAEVGNRRRSGSLDPPEIACECCKL